MRRGPAVFSLVLSLTGLAIASLPTRVAAETAAEMLARESGTSRSEQLGIYLKAVWDTTPYIGAVVVLALVVGAARYVIGRRRR